ncbi:MAG: ABC transporter ATP-binding protein [Bacteroidales bacterium]|jgi:iron complex transport system ATP-binding protein
MIKIENITTGYKSLRRKGKDKAIHSNLNLEIKKGELICLIGANGSGKSTLIKTLNGSLKPLKGNIQIDGINLNKINPNDLAKKIGVVLATFPTIDNIKSSEVIAMGRYPYCGMFGKLNEHDNAIIDQAVQAVGISKLYNLYFNQMSDGEKQKVMIAKTLAQETPYIVLDEPLAFLDYPSRLDIMTLLKNLAKNHNKGVLFSTHNLEMALDVCDIIWLMDKKGNFAQTSRDAITHNLLEKYFNKQTADSLILD